MSPVRPVVPTLALNWCNVILRYGREQQPGHVFATIAVEAGHGLTPRSLPAQRPVPSGLVVDVHAVRTVGLKMFGSRGWS